MRAALGDEVRIDRGRRRGDSRGPPTARCSCASTRRRVNAVDWYGFKGRPYVARPLMGLRKPKSSELGGDFAGVVEAVGAGVDDFAPGDEVYGCDGGAFAEYVVASAASSSGSRRTSRSRRLPRCRSQRFTALQGLRDHGGVQAGQRVVVNGASGGVGTFAVQVAKALGAEVHAVCSTRNVEQARQLGADRVFDYTREDFTRSGARYDVLFDNAGNRSWHAMRRVLAPTGDRRPRRRAAQPAPARAARAHRAHQARREARPANGARSSSRSRTATISPRCVS